MGVSRTDLLPRSAPADRVAELESAEGLTEAEAVRQFVRDQRSSAFEWLAARHRDHVYDLALWMLKDPAQAEDCAQETFLALYLHAAEIQPGTPLAAWLLRVTRRLALNHLRGARRRERRDQEHAMEQSAITAPAPSAAELNEQRTWVREAVGRLPEEYRLPIVLHYFHGLAKPEIATALEIPEGTVGSRLARGLERLRAGLAGGSGPSPAALGVVTVAALEPLLHGVGVSQAPAVVGACAKVAALAAQHSAVVAATAATKAAGAGAGTLLTLKLAVGASVLAASAAVGVWVAQLNPQPTVSAAVPAAPEVAPTPVLAGPPDKAAPPETPAKPGDWLRTVLKTKVTLRFQRSFPQEVLDELHRWAGLHAAMPAGLRRDFIFTLDAKEMPVEEVLNRLKDAGGMGLECPGDTVVLWRRADDRELVTLEERLSKGNLDERCEAVSDLARLSDPRIYPLLARAAAAPEPVVAQWAIRSLHKWHRDTLCSTALARTLIQRQEQRRAQCRGTSTTSAEGKTILTVIGMEELALLGATRAPEAVEFLLKAYEKASDQERQGVVLGLGQTHDARACAVLVEELKKLPVYAGTIVQALDTPEGKDLLLQTLKSLPPEKGYFVAQWLDSATDPRRIEVLLPWLESKNESVFRTAGKALTPYRDTRATEAVLARAKRENLSHMGEVCGLLAASGDPRAIQLLVEMVRHPNPKGIRPPYYLAKVDSPEAVKALAELFDRPPDEKGAPSERVQILSSLREVHAPEAAAIFEKGLADPVARGQALMVLSGKREDWAWDLLQRFVPTATEQDQRTALGFLFLSRAPKAVALLKEYQAKGATYVNQSAAWSISNAFHDWAALEWARELARDPDPKVRAALASSLGRSVWMRSPIARGWAELAAKLAEDPEVTVRKDAAAALGAADHALATRPLLKLLRDEKSSVRQAATLALRKSPDARARDGLIEALKDADSTVRSQAADALGELRDPTATAPLAALLNDANATVRQQAACALGFTADPRAVEPLKKRLEAETDSRSRQFLLTALGRISSPEALRELGRRATGGKAEDRHFAAWVLRIVARWPEDFPANEKVEIEKTLPRAGGASPAVKPPPPPDTGGEF